MNREGIGGGAIAGIVIACVLLFLAVWWRYAHYHPMRKKYKAAVEAMKVRRLGPAAGGLKQRATPFIVIAGAMLVAIRPANMEEWYIASSATPPPPSYAS